MSDEILNGDTETSVSTEAPADPVPGGESDLAAAEHSAQPPITEQTVVVDSHSDTAEAHAVSEVSALSDASKQPDGQPAAPTEELVSAAPAAAVAEPHSKRSGASKREDFS